MEDKGELKMIDLSDYLIPAIAVCTACAMALIVLYYLEYVHEPTAYIGFCILLVPVLAIFAVFVDGVSVCYPTDVSFQLACDESGIPSTDDDGHLYYYDQGGNPVCINQWSILPDAIGVGASECTLYKARRVYGQVYLPYDVVLLTQEAADALGIRGVGLTYQDLTLIRVAGQDASPAAAENAPASM